MTIIAPSILSCDFANLAKEIQAVESAGADWIHVDVMDGRFVPNLTIGPILVEAARRCTELPLDVHLMMVEPERWLEAFAEAGADHIIVHAEASIHLQRTLQGIRQLGKKAGVALNPSTPESVIEYVLNDLDIVLVMSVNPGFGGQSFLPVVLEKISRIKNMLQQANNSECIIEVDGGINPETALAATEAGADAFVAGHAVFDSDDYAQAISDLKK